MVLHLQNPVVSLQQVLLASSVRISPFPPPFSYAWVVALSLGEPITGLPKAEQLTRVAVSDPVNTGPKVNSSVSRKKQQEG